VASPRSRGASACTSASVAPKPVRLRRWRAPASPMGAAQALQAMHRRAAAAAALMVPTSMPQPRPDAPPRIAPTGLAVAVPAHHRRAQLVGRDEAVLVRVDLVEVLEEAGRVRLRLISADAPVAVGVELLPVLGLALLVKGAQLLGSDLAVVGRVALFLVTREHGQCVGLFA